MIGSGDYPPGAEFDPDAPWNEVDLPEREVDVTVSVTLSKSFKVAVSDYTVERTYDEDGYYEDEDYSECDLYKAASEQIVMPQDLADCIEKLCKDAGIELPSNIKRVLEDCKKWSVDDIEVIKE